MGQVLVRIAHGSLGFSDCWNCCCRFIWRRILKLPATNQFKRFLENKMKAACMKKGMIFLSVINPIPR